MDGAVPALIEEFSRVLSRQVEVIQQAMRDVLPDLPPEVKKSQAYDARAAAAAIAHLRALLESSDGGASDAFLALEGALAGTFDEPRLRALSADISDFDFDRALSKLDEIAKEYGANWEQAK